MSLRVKGQKKYYAYSLSFTPFTHLINPMKTCLLVLFILSTLTGTAVEKSNFANQTIDIGLVVTDIKKSLQFYKEVVGFQEKDGFKVAGKFPKLVAIYKHCLKQPYFIKATPEERLKEIELAND